MTFDSYFFPLLSSHSLSLFLPLYLSYTITMSETVWLTSQVQWQKTESNGKARFTGGLTFLFKIPQITWKWSQRYMGTCCTKNINVLYINVIKYYIIWYTYMGIKGSQKMHPSDFNSTEFFSPAVMRFWVKPIKHYWMDCNEARLYSPQVSCSLNSSWQPFELICIWI